MNRRQIHLFVLTLVTMLMLGGYIFLVTLCKFAKDEQILTALITLAGLALNFWFGSTASGQKKDELIASMAPPTPSPEKP